MILVKHSIEDNYGNANDVLPLEDNDGGDDDDNDGDDGDNDGLPLQQPL